VDFDKRIQEVEKKIKHHERFGRHLWDAIEGAPTVGGGGLDAETLDGHDSTYFSVATHNHDSTYLPISSFTDSWAEVAFTYATTSPLTLAVVTVGQRVLKAAVQIVTAFDDPAATVTIGHTGVVGGLLSSTECVATAAGYYEASPMFQYGGADTIKLWITKGTSTQGAGVAYLWLTE
jgi:hypothetical protein